MAVYDTREDAWRHLSDERREEFCTWLGDHGLDPNRIYRVEVGVLNAKIFEFAVDDSGTMYKDPATGEAAKREPYKIPVISMPPLAKGGVLGPEETP